PLTVTTDSSYTNARRKKIILDITDPNNDEYSLSPGIYFIYLKEEYTGADNKNNEVDDPVKKTVKKPVYVY
ncbi:MAG TPA: hypothetical protein VKS21_00680, partial [Spirochaetota bacterium]|nr:hypothetical protein [Spirochaetota bacterium]